MNQPQTPDNEVATPRVDELDYNQEIKSYRIWDLARELEREVARLRQTLEFIANDTATHDSTAYYRTLAQAALAPAPEETQDGATMSEWYRGYTKIESTEPAPEEPKGCIHPSIISVTHRGEKYDQCSKCGKKFKAPAPEEAATVEVKEPAPEWRELGPDEVIQVGDEVQPKHHSRDYEWVKAWSFEIGVKSGHFKAMRYRTRRPLPVQEEKCPHHCIVPLEDGDQILIKCTRCGALVGMSNKPLEGKLPLTRESYDEDWNLKPKQEEMPLESDLQKMEAIAEGSWGYEAKGFGLMTSHAIRYLRDEVRKLKERTNICLDA